MYGWMRSLVLVITHPLFARSYADLFQLQDEKTNFHDILIKIKKIQANAFKNMVCKMAGVISRPRRA